jgi:hypothetical protein
MHRVPFGQIVFDKEIDGASTFIDDHGFHVLCHIYDERTDEWNMVKAGKWGFSYGFQPATEGGMEMRKLANGHMVPAFVKGTFYEVSVVDTPSQLDAVAYVINRMIDSHKGGNIMTSEEQRYVPVGSVPEKLGTGGYACKVGDEWKLPIHDAAHCRNAMARYNQAEGCQTSEVKARICAAAKYFGIDNAFEKGGFCYTGEERNMENKEEFEQWLKDAETRIIDKVTKALAEKKSATNLEDTVKQMEQRIMNAVEKKLAEQTPEKSRVEQTFESVNAKLAAIDAKIANLKGIEKSLKGAGEDYKALSERIAAYEKERDALSNTIVDTVTKTVEKSLGKVEDRLSAIENIPDLKSTATLGEKSGVYRGVGFGAMLEAARRGTQ